MYIGAYCYFLPFYHVVYFYNLILLLAIMVYCNWTVLWLLWLTNFPICRTKKGTWILIHMTDQLFPCRCRHLIAPCIMIIAFLHRHLTACNMSNASWHARAITTRFIESNNLSPGLFTSSLCWFHINAWCNHAAYTTSASDEIWHYFLIKVTKVNTCCNITVVWSCNFALWVQAWDISFSFWAISSERSVQSSNCERHLDVTPLFHPSHLADSHMRGIMSCHSLDKSTEGSEQNKTVPPFRQRNFHTDNMVGLFFFKDPDWLAVFVRMIFALHF